MSEQSEAIKIAQQMEQWARDFSTDEDHEVFLGWARAVRQLDTDNAEAEQQIEKLNEKAVELLQLREQLAHTEADFEACNDISCRRWEEIQRLREQLVIAKKALSQIGAGSVDDDYPFRAMPREKMRDVAHAAMKQLFALTDEIDVDSVSGTADDQRGFAITDEQRVYAGGGDGTFNESEPDDEFVRKARAVHTDEQQPQPRGSGDHRSF